MRVIRILCLVAFMLLNHIAYSQGTFTAVKPIGGKVVKHTLTGKYARLVVKGGSTPKYYFVSSDSLGKVKGIAFRYGGIYTDTSGLNTPGSGWVAFSNSVIDNTPTPNPTNYLASTPTLRTLTGVGVWDSYAARPVMPDEVQANNPVGSSMHGYVLFGIDTQRDEGGSASTIKGFKMEYIPPTDPANIYVQNNITYYIKPTWSMNATTPVFDFSSTFPTFTPPIGKFVGMDKQTETDAIQLGSYQRGVTHSKVGPKKIVFLSDEIWWNLGCPRAYVTPLSDFVTWIQNVQKENIQNMLMNLFATFNNDDFIFFNNECIKSEDQHPTIAANMWKIDEAYQACRAAYPNVKWSIYGWRPITTGKFLWRSNLAQLKAAWESSPSIEHATANYPINTVRLRPSRWATYQTISDVNDGTMDGDYLLNMMGAYLLNKKFYPNNKWLAYPSQFVEFEMGQTRTEYPINGVQCYTWGKAATPPSTNYNRAIWGIAMADGVYMWGEPRLETNDVTKYIANDDPNHPSMGTFRLDNFQPLPAPNYNYIAGKPVIFYPQTQKNVDWMMAGVWAVSQPDVKAIIEDAGAWVWYRNPFDADLNNLPMLAYKQVGNKILVLCYSNQSDGEQEHHFAINNVIYTVKTWGDFTSVAIINL